MKLAIFFCCRVILTVQVRSLPNVIQMKDSFNQLDHPLMVLEWKGPVSVGFLGEGSNFARRRVNDTVTNATSYHTLFHVVSA